MIIYETLDAARRGEPGLFLADSGEHSPVGTFEKDWGYRLRGAGLPGDQIGWLLTFAGHGDGFGDNDAGWLIAYAIADNKKTGRVAVLRRNWTGAVDEAELTRVRSDPQLWQGRYANVGGEADLDALDVAVAGDRL